MSLRLALGIIIFAAGVAMMPFGWWLARIYYYGGLLLVAVGGALAFSAYRYRKDDGEGWSPKNDPPIPVVGDARGFKGREVFNQSDGDGSDGTD
jgi:hypothetical protein